MDEQSHIAEQNIDVLVFNCLRLKRKLKSDQITRGVNYNVDDLEMLLLMETMLLHMIVWLLDDQTSLDIEVHGRTRHFGTMDDLPF